MVFDVLWLHVLSVCFQSVSFPSPLAGTNQSNSSSVDSPSTPTAPTTPDSYTSPIYTYAATANVNELHKLIVTDKANVNETNKDGMTATHIAAETGNEGAEMNSY